MLVGGEMDWRTYFIGSGYDICTVIEQAVLIAGEDNPDELRTRRDGITERLYCASTSDVRQTHSHNAGLDASVKNAVYVENPIAPSVPDCEVRFRDEQAGGGSSDERGVSVGKDVDDEEGRCTTVRQEEDDGDERNAAEMLADEMEEEETLANQVWTVKERLKSIDLTEDDVLTAMEELLEMNISLQILQVTKIGQQIMSFKKNPSPEVQQLARALIKKWKEVVNSRRAPAAASTVTVGEEEEPVSGLALPPMDEGALMDDRDITLTGINEVLEMLDSDSAISAEDIGGILHSIGCTILDENRKPEAKPKQQLPPGVASPESRQVASMKGSSIAVSATPGAPKLTQCTAAVKDTKQRADKARVAKQVPAEKISTAVKLPSKEGGVSPPLSNGEERVIVKTDKKPPIGRILARDREVVSKVDRAEDPEAMQHRLTEGTKRMNERYEDIERSKRARTVQVLEVTVLPKAKTIGGGNTSTSSKGASAKGSLMKKMQKLKAGKGW